MLEVDLGGGGGEGVCFVKDVVGHNKQQKFVVLFYFLSANFSELKISWKIFYWLRFLVHFL